MSNHPSLVIFTLMVQSAVGSVWCLQAAFWGQGGPLNSLHLKFQIWAAFGLVLAGLAAAMIHLGRPGYSLQSVKNVKSSWLSREILSVNLLAGLLAVMAALAHLGFGDVTGRLLLAVCLSGAGVLYAMVRVYRLRTVPSWNHAGTPLAFVGSALLLGGLLCAMVAETVGLLQGVEPGAMVQDGHGYPALIFVWVGFILKLIAASMKPSRRVEPGVSKTRQPVLQGAGLVLWMVYALAAVSPIYRTSLLLFAAGFLICGEIFHRIQFYDSYRRVGI